MTTIQFLTEWALRSSILILSGLLLLWALRVKDPCIRLATWTAILCGSLAIPALTAALPNLPLVVVRLAPRSAEQLVVVNDSAPTPMPPAARQNALLARPGDDRIRPFNWVPIAMIIYAVVVLALLVRLCVGLALSLRLLRSSHATGRTTEGIEIRESDCVATPVTLGIARPAIVLPSDWSQWSGAKLDAVLAHECSHIRRYDPALQLLSAIHRALLWHSPLSWFLHKRIVRVAEEASDDAAVAVTRNRAAYAEVLLDFMRRGVRGASWRGPHWSGVPMARYGRADKRTHRILDETVLSRGVTRWSVVAILALGSPLVYVVAAAHPQSVSQAHSEAATPALNTAPAGKAVASDTPLVKPLSNKPRESSVGPPPNGRSGTLVAPQIIPQSGAQSAGASGQESPAVSITALGTVTANTVTVKPRVDGQLLSVTFKEGDLVQAGQVLASLDPRSLQFQLDQAEGQLAQDQGQPSVAFPGGKVKADQAAVDNAKLQLSYAQVIAPITGVAGLRLVDPGNIVHADVSGIVIINQLQPIAVVFSVTEDKLRQVLARVKEGVTLPAEACNRDLSVTYATGRLTAVDNQIDSSTGTAKLKAVFDNKDGALFPNQFVIVRLFLNAK